MFLQKDYELFSKTINQVSIDFLALLCYTIYIKGFCTEKGQKSKKSVKM